MSEYERERFVGLIVMVSKIERMAPVRLGLYAEDGMVLNQLMAFKVNMDHEREVQVWEASHSFCNKELS